nr:alpha/beta fold hydrolase [Stackebrandtia nassauensis]
MPTPTRRTVLRGLVLAGGAAMAATATGVALADDKRPKTYVFVHGTNSYSGFWTPYARELQYRGHRCIAVDQPYHGAGAYIPESYQSQDLEALATEPTPLGEIGLDDFAAHVEKSVRRAAKWGPVVLVGHSMGGASLSRVGDAVPELIAHLCYMAAYCCSTALPTIEECMTAPESETAILPEGVVIGDPEVLGVNRYNFLGASAEDLRMLKEMAWGDNSDASFRAGLLSMQPDESALVPAQRAVGGAEGWGGIRRTYLRFGADRLITPELQDRMIAEADDLTPDNRFRVHDFDAPHFGPEDVSDIVDVLAGLE